MNKNRLGQKHPESQLTIALWEQLLIDFLSMQMNNSKLWVKRRETREMTILSTTTRKTVHPQYRLTWNFEIVKLDQLDVTA